MRLGLFAGVTLGVLVGCTSTAGPPKPRQPVHSDCLFRQFVEDWSPLDNEHLIIFGPGRQDAFLARLAIPTPDLMLDIGVTIVDDDRNGQICGGATDGLVFGPRSAVPGKINLASMQKIDRAQAEQLVSLSKARDKEALASGIAAVGQPAR